MTVTLEVLVEDFLNAWRSDVVNLDPYIERLNAYQSADPVAKLAMADSENPTVAALLAEVKRLRRVVSG